VTRRRGRPPDAQLVLDFDRREHPAVERARNLRVEAGLPPSLTSSDVLAQIRVILDVDGTLHRSTPEQRAS